MGCFRDLQVVFCGMMSSSGLWGSICDKYGRKTVSVTEVHSICDKYSRKMVSVTEVLGYGAVYVTRMAG